MLHSGTCSHEYTDGFDDASVCKWACGDDNDNDNDGNDSDTL